MDNRAIGASFLRAIVAERVITVLTRVLTDVPMVAILAWDSGLVGTLLALVVVTPIYFLLCVAIVVSSDLAQEKKGIDITGLETLRELEGEILEEKRWVSRVVQKVLKSRKLIFWVGSWFYLDPDYVTLLLRKKEEGYAHTFLRITLPAVLISMVVWLGVWWAAVKGYHLAQWFLDWVL